jgi:hypothetical protein
MVANLFRNSTRKMAFAPMMIRRNGMKVKVPKTTNNYPPLPASPVANNNNLFDPVYNGNRNKYLKTLKNRYKNRNQRLRVLNRALNMNVNTKRNLRALL